MKRPIWLSVAMRTHLLLLAAAGCAESAGTGPEPARVASITVTPSSATFTFLGEVGAFAAAVRDQSGAAFPGTVAWTGDAPDVFTVDSGGSVTSVSNGTGTLSAELNGVVGTATVVVGQRPAVVERVSGDEQRGLAGAPLDDRVVARVLDAGGAPVAGEGVAFSPTRGGGSVSPGSATTDAVGEVRAVWTLGDAPGQQSLTASVEVGASTVFRATALGVPAEIAIAAGDGQEAPVATAVAVPPEVLVTHATGAPLSGVPVVFTTERDASVTDAEVHTDAQGRASPGRWTLGTSTGVYRLTASLDGDGIKGNPLHFEAVALAGPAAQLVAIEGDGQESEIALPVRIVPRVRVEDAYGNPVAGIRVDFFASDESEVIPTEVMTDSDGAAAVDKWILGRTTGATYSLIASVTGAGSTADPVFFTAAATPAVYDIELVHVSSSLLTESHRQAFEKAEQFWERAITGNLGWSTLRKPQLEDCLARSDITEEIPGDRVVDDLLIYVQIKEIDGRAGVFGGAGPCQIRVGNSLPAVGVMFFDLGDMDGLESNGHLEGTILHEMAHVIGFGTLWDHLGLLRDPARLGRSANTHFAGDTTIAAFHDIRGDHYPDSELVPVQNLGGEGVWNGHWRELVFRTELMTPFIDSGLNPLSAVSIASLVDIGYEGVDYSVADEYVLPPPPYSVLGGKAAAGKARAVADTRIDLGNDILWMPLSVVDRDGNVLRVIPPPPR